jgi:hypothetical protein
MADAEAVRDLSRNLSNRAPVSRATSHGADPSVFCRARSLAGLSPIRLGSPAPGAEIGRPGDRRDQHNEKKDLHGVSLP